MCIMEVLDDSYDDDCCCHRASHHNYVNSSRSHGTNVSVSVVGDSFESAG